MFAMAEKPPPSKKPRIANAATAPAASGASEAAAVTVAAPTASGASAAAAVMVAAPVRLSLATMLEMDSVQARIRI